MENILDYITVSHPEFGVCFLWFKKGHKYFLPKEVKRDNEGKAMPEPKILITLYKGAKGLRSYTSVKDLVKDGVVGVLKSHVNGEKTEQAFYSHKTFSYAPETFGQGEEVVSKYYIRTKINKHLHCIYECYNLEDGFQVERYEHGEDSNIEGDFGLWYPYFHLWATINSYMPKWLGVGYSVNGTNAEKLYPAKTLFKI